MKNHTLTKLSPVDSEIRNTVVHSLKAAGLTNNSIASIMKLTASTVSRILDKKRYDQPLRKALKLD